MSACTAATASPESSFSPSPSSRRRRLPVGYDVNAAVYLDVNKPAALAFYGVMPGADGCFALTITTDKPGMYHLETRQQLKGKRWVTMATYDLPVVL